LDTKDIFDGIAAVTPTFDKNESVKHLRNVDNFFFANCKYLIFNCTYLMFV